MKTSAKLFFISFFFLSFLFIGCELVQDVIDNPEIISDEQIENLVNTSLESIEIKSKPSKTVYYMGDEFDQSGLKVIGKFDNGLSADVTKYVTCSGFDSSAVNESQTIIVSLSDKTADFTIRMNYQYLFCDTPRYTGDCSAWGWQIVEFGDFPQNVVSEDDVASLGLETSTVKIKRGYLEYVLGNDRNYYVKCKERGYKVFVKAYSDNSTVKTEDADSYRWFKVMPLRWHLVNNAYDIDHLYGYKTAKLLVADKILTGGIPFNDDVEARIIEGVTVYANNYAFSKIRAYLNGYDYFKPTKGTNTEISHEYHDNNGRYGFLQAAFTEDGQNKINTTYVRNDVLMGMNTNKYVIAPTIFVCPDTMDKVFLLSLNEEEWYVQGIRAPDLNYPYAMRYPTDFARANCVKTREENHTSSPWYLRSPRTDEFDKFKYWHDWCKVRGISELGDYVGIYNDSNFEHYYAYDKNMGILPAITVNF